MEPREASQGPLGPCGTSRNLLGPREVSRSLAEPCGASRSHTEPRGASESALASRGASRSLAEPRRAPSNFAESRGASGSIRVGCVGSQALGPLRRTEWSRRGVTRSQLASRRLLVEKSCFGGRLLGLTLRSDNAFSRIPRNADPPATRKRCGRCSLPFPSIFVRARRSGHAQAVAHHCECSRARFAARSSVRRPCGLHRSASRRWLRGGARGRDAKRYWQGETHKKGGGVGRGAAHHPLKAWSPNCG